MSRFYNTPRSAAGYHQGMLTTTHATSTFAVKSWDEHPLSDVDGHAKITRASVVFAYHGDLEGEGSVEYLMAYRDKGSS